VHIIYGLRWHMYVCEIGELFNVSCVCQIFACYINVLFVATLIRCAHICYLFA
jgi:hypothetical protein